MKIVGKDGNIMEVYGLLDQGSEVTLIEQRAADELGLEGEISKTQMGALPTCRLQVGRPAFNCTGVDYFGLIEVTIFRRKVKRWGCLFTCLTTRAVHLEMAYTLDTDSFLAAMLRFEQRRGTPAAYYSDRGTNFVGAQNELRECLDRLDEKRIHERLSLRHVKWVFNPPGAPHFGGAWER